MPDIITPGLITALFTGWRRQFQTAYDSAVAASFWNRVATEVTSSTSSNTYGWLGDFPDMIEWVGARTIKDMEAHGYQIVNKSYEGTVGVPRTKILDDELGIYGPMIQTMGQAAARQPDQLISDLLKVADATVCFDGQFFFDTDHPVNAEHDGSGADASVSNIQPGVGVGPKWFLFDTSRPLKPLIHQVRKAPEFVQKTNPNTSDDVFMNDRFLYGVDARRNVGFGFWQQAYQSRETLDSANLDAAIQAMMEFKGDGGRPLGIMPNLLVVPPALRSDANKTVKVMLGDGGASNPNYQAVDVLVVPWLA